MGLLGNNEIALSVVMTAGVAIALAASLASASSGRGDGVAPAQGSDPGVWVLCGGPVL